ncbi:MAG: glutaredoxin family protein [Chloroflexota bacterium]|nr:glutaredoxin family protein [Chloroflexota bacterium]
MSQARGNVSGSRNEHHMVLYAISTCIWCKRTRQFLESQGVSFDYIYIDLIHGQERENVLAQVKRWNPAVSFPTLVVDGRQSVLGYKPEAIKRALGL